MSPDVNLRAEILKAANVSRAGIDKVVANLEGDLGDAVLEAIEVVAGQRGRVILTGVGKKRSYRRKGCRHSGIDRHACLVHPRD